MCVASLLTGSGQFSQLAARNRGIEGMRRNLETPVGGRPSLTQGVGGRLAPWPLRSAFVKGYATSSGQALVELAIIGSISLLAMAFFIQVGLRMNYDQEITQNSFRRALLFAKCEGDEKEPTNWCSRRVPFEVNLGDESQAIAYNRFRNRRMPNPSVGFGVKPTTLISSRATVTWGERLTFLGNDSDSEPRVVVKLNDDPPRLLRSGDFRNPSAPFRSIEKRTDASGTVSQGTSGSTLIAQTTETTTINLNTPNDDKISSTTFSLDTNQAW